MIEQLDGQVVALEHSRQLGPDAGVRDAVGRGSGDGLQQSIVARVDCWRSVVVEKVLQDERSTGLDQGGERCEGAISVGDVAEPVAAVDSVQRAGLESGERLEVFDARVVNLLGGGVARIEMQKESA